MYDIAIIGSGVSGARMAHELTVGGAKCVMLEAGEAFDRHSFPRDELGYSTRMFWGGGLEISRDGRFGFLRGKCLGGTSVVNQADLDEFDELALDQWRDRSGVAWLRADEMAPWYQKSLGQVASTEIPEAYWNRNARLFIDAFDHGGWHWKPIRRGQSDCALDRGSDCIVCLGGCPRDAKQSVLVTAIPQAIAAGLHVETHWEAESLDIDRDGVEVLGTQRGQPARVRAAKVVLAAGAFGNTAILARTPGMLRRLPALGTAFCCHPQYMTFGVYDEPVDAHKGALQSVQAHDERFRRAGVKFENVFAPPIATAMLLPGVGRAHHELARKYRHLACIEIAVQDEPTGQITLDKRGNLVRHKPLTDLDRQRIKRGLDQAIEWHNVAGARAVIRSDQGFGLHLMGGCPIGTDPRTSVVDPGFRVHGFPRLVIADSSVFPQAPGINPSLTIMALSNRASCSLLQG
ncbi:MAG: GMC family oxidoreductase [Pirellulales bacterium]|nr:GMC family oxidoreductase [Pirellulales bacterium]